MCDLYQKVEKYLHKNAHDEALQGSAFKWMPLKTKAGCSCCKVKSASKCSSTKRLIENFCRLMVDFVNPIVDTETCEAVVPKKNAEAFLLFNEVDRITKSRKLTRKTKLGLIARPDYATVFKFVQDLVSRAHLTPEILISTMVLIDRFREMSGWELFSTTWRIVLILSVRLSQKVEGHAFLSCKELQRLYPLFSSDEFNGLEYEFLDLIEYKSLVDMETFAKFHQFLFYYGQ